MFSGLAHILVQYVIGSVVVAFLIVPCLMARSVDLNSEEPDKGDRLSDGV